MKYLVIKPSTMEALEHLAEANDATLRFKGHKICSGHWEVEVDEEVAEGLAKLSDDPDEAIMMLVTGQWGRA